MVPLDKTNALKPLKTQGLIKHMLRRRITHDQVAPSLSKGYLPVSNNASIISDAALIIALLLWANNYKRPLRDSVICGERADLAILSDPLALKRVKRFWWSGYAIAGVCGVRVILFAAPRRFCSIAAIAKRAFCSGQPEILSGASSCQNTAQSLKQRLEISLPPPSLVRNPRQGGGVGAAKNRDQNGEDCARNCRGLDIIFFALQQSSNYSEVLMGRT